MAAGHEAGMRGTYGRWWEVRAITRTLEVQEREGERPRRVNVACVWVGGSERHFPIIISIVCHVTSRQPDRKLCLL